MFDNNFTDKITVSFLGYLDESGVSPNTVKFYKSDLSHFTGWLLLKVRTLGSEAQNLTEAIPFLSKDLALEYLKFLIDNKVATLTANRRLSSLRNLARFLIASQIVDFDFMDGLSNLSSHGFESLPILRDFEKHLRQKKVSDNTIKSYLSDVKQFISWVETH